jgi:hypothetical protein
VQAFAAIAIWPLRVHVDEAACGHEALAVLSVLNGVWQRYGIGLVVPWAVVTVRVVNACDVHDRGVTEVFVSWFIAYPWLSTDDEVSGKSIDTEDCCSRHLQEVANAEVSAGVSVIPG